MKYQIHNRFLYKAALLFLVLSFLCGCAKKEIVVIDDVNDLHGLKVGVNVAWECDYVLTGRSDMEIYRYDMTADMLMALNYNNVDAIAVDDVSWRILSSNSTGLEKIEPEFAVVGYILYFAGDKGELAEEYNSFLAEFKKTDDYKALIDRINSYDGNDYEMPDIPVNKDGKTVRIAFDVAGYPRAYLETDGSCVGFDIEMALWFGAKCGYNIELVPTEFNEAIIGLKNGTYDAALGYISDVYADEARMCGFIPSDSYGETPLYLVKKNTTGNISINSEILG